LNGIEYDGEWTQVLLPVAVKVKYLDVYYRYSSKRQTRDGTVLGSNDGANWTHLQSWDDLPVTTSPSVIHHLQVNSTKYFKYIRYIVERVAGETLPNIREIEIWGTEEGDESVDIVHRSIPNTPGQQQLAVYYEARDPNSYSFADSTKVYDLSGNGVTGTITGNNGFDAEYNAWVFDGSGDYISGTQGLGTGNIKYSVSLWFKADITSGNHRLMSFGAQGTAYQSSTLLIYENDIHLDHWLSEIKTTTDVITAGKWYHVVAIHSGTGTNNINENHIYLNGVKQTVEAGGASGNGTFNLQGNSLALGADPNGTNPFDGSIANFRLYSKALNADQVRELYEYDAERFGHRQNLVALHKGNLGVGVTNPTSRFEVAGADGLQEYPPKAMTGYETYIEGHGVFKTNPTILISLGVYATPTWKVFDRSTDYLNNVWVSERDSGEVSGSSGFYTGTSNTYTGTNSLNGLYGDYIILENPYKINVTKMYLKPRISGGNATNVIRAFTLMANNDGSTWDILAQKSDLTSWTTDGYTFDVQNTNHYIYYALVVTQTVGSYASLSELRYYGTPAPSSLEDGHLTLGKALTLPRVSGHPAGVETPRAESLVVHYDTTVDSVVSGTTVVDTSGNGLNGTLNGAVYDTTERALTFDGVNDYIFTGSIGNPAGAWIHSYSMWINLDSYSDKNIVLIGKDELTSRASSIALKSSTAIQWFFFGNDVTFSHSMSLGSWYHIAAVYDGGAPDSSRRMWINGTELTISLAGAGTALNLYANAEMRIGRRQFDSYPYYFNGSISNFKLWNVALTAEEVAMEYALGRTGKSINLTDTALCLGGTVPRAQLDVRGSALVEGNLTIEGGGITRSGNGTIPIMGRVSNAFVTTSSSSPDILISGLLENVNINRLRTAAYSATVVMTGANISAAGSRALGEFLSFGEVSGSDTHTELAYGFYDGSYTKGAILKFSIGSDNRSITVYQTGAQYTSGQVWSYNTATWTIATNGPASYGVKDLTILY
jgi:hypothetical protein